MGSACCVAARDRTITNGSNGDVIPRNIRYSPSWSVRWDNRRRVAGEEASMTWYSDGVGTNDRLDNKSLTTVGTATAYASEEGSPLESFRNLTWQKSSPSEGYPVPQSGKLSRPIFLQKPNKVITLHTLSRLVLFTTPFTIFPTSRPTPIKTPHPFPYPPPTPPGVRHPYHPSTKSPNFSISEEGSPFMLTGYSNESNRGSHGSSDGWSMPPFNTDSFDSESFNFKTTRSSGRVSSSPSIDMRTCGVCSKLLTEKSSWGTQKIIANNELAVVAILICGHVYHAECLENMTAEINKYDPACPVCTFGEKQTFKLSEKALKAEMELKARISKKSRSRVVDGEMDGGDFMFDHSKSRSYKMSSSSSMKNSVGKPPF